MCVSTCLHGSPNLDVLDETKCLLSCSTLLCIYLVFSEILKAGFIFMIMPVERSSSFRSRWDGADTKRYVRTKDATISLASNAAKCCPIPVVARQNIFKRESILKIFQDRYIMSIELLNLQFRPPAKKGIKANRLRSISSAVTLIQRSGQKRSGSSQCFG